MNPTSNQRRTHVLWKDKLPKVQIEHTFRVCMKYFTDEATLILETIKIY